MTLTRDQLKLAAEKFREFADDLWQIDQNNNGAKVGDELMLNLGNKTYYRNRKDSAKSSLISSIELSLLKKPTIKSFLALLDNYSTSTGIAEIQTKNERNEEKDFIEYICETNVMKNFSKWLVENRFLTSKNPEIELRKLLDDLWFDMYGRNYRTRQKHIEDSSAFEHVFVGETGRGKISGFHNWLQFYRLESRGLIDYRGFYPNREGNDILLTIKFRAQCEDGHVEKPKGGFLIGTSPEFEIAIYTAAHLLAGGKDDFECPIKINGGEILLKTFSKNGRFMAAYCQ